MGSLKYRTCELPDCDKKHYGKGLCAAHYRRLQRGQELRPIIAPYGRENDRRCEHSWCERFSVTDDGYCVEHYAQYVNRKPKRLCFISGCSLDYYCNGACKKHHNSLYRFNISVIQYNEMFISGACEICASTSNLVIDHDHKCCPGKTKKLCGRCNRGVICGNCNISIGHAKENTETLKRMVSYLNGS